MTVTTFIAFAVLGIYTVALLYITLYCVLQFDLLYHYQRRPDAAARAVSDLMVNSKKQHAASLVAAGEDGESEEEEPHEFPFVTVQLPIFNELYVIARLIDTVAEFDYPRDRFEVHVLDDSNDETVEVVAAKVAEWQARGLQIEQIRRPVREGYKAGALRDGMEFARGEFIAIFDADFLPRRDFLRQTIPHFATDPAIGVVQTRWEHINRDYSIITRLQALQLNVHFTVEQVGRMNAGHLLQFNGTAGVWRRQTIEDAGGWEADTLTEDLDLSIRAQLAGYRIHFLEEIGSPAELPAEMNSFKSQQHRWMKGGAETARKMLPAVWRSPLALRHKVHGTAHLLGSTIFVFVFICGVSSVPLLYFLPELTSHGLNKNLFTGFLVGLLSIIAIYYVANVRSPAVEVPWGRAMRRFAGLFPLFLALSMGLSLHNTVAVFQGYRGKKSPFVRTPKFNINGIGDTFRRKKYFTGSLNAITIGEGLLSLYFLLAVAFALYWGATTFLLFHLLLAIGFGSIFYFSLRHLNPR